MPTYKNVAKHVLANGGGYVAPCHIAHVRAYHGLTTRIASNRIDPNRRVKPCPPPKWGYIEQALFALGALK
jgi:hypothetical protein